MFCRCASIIQFKIRDHAAYKILLLLSGQLEAALQESGRSAEKTQIRADF